MDIGGSYRTPKAFRGFSAVAAYGIWRALCSENDETRRRLEARESTNHRRTGAWI